MKSIVRNKVYTSIDFLIYWNMEKLVSDVVGNLVNTKIRNSLYWVVFDSVKEDVMKSVNNINNEQ